MPDSDTDKLVADLRGSVSGLANASPVVAPAHALASLGDTASAAVSKARSFADDLGDHIRAYFTTPRATSLSPSPITTGRDIELPPDKPKRLAKPRTMSGGKR